MRILAIEDEPAIVRVLERAMRAHGYSLLAARTGEDGVTIAATEPVDLVLLDIALPGQDGHRTLAQLRALRRDLPIIMLTARDDLTNKVSALEAGADDYLTKPFALEELIARIRALTRRSDQVQASILEIGDIKLDLATHRCWRGSTAIDLSSREFALLEYFLRNAGRLLTRQQILAAIWDYDFDPESNVVDVYVRYLRRKLDRAGEPSVITTLRGSGYRLDIQAGAFPDAGERAT